MVFWGGGWGGRRRGGGWGPGGGYGPGYGPGFGRRGFGGGYGGGYGGGGGGSCLRDLLFLDAGCCLADALGCGPNLVLLAPVVVGRRPRFDVDGGSTGRVTARLLAGVRAYRREISPRRPPVCRFTPSCSCYAEEALQRHGALRGSWLTARRLLRCHPWASGGADPVPAGQVGEAA